MGLVNAPLQQTVEVLFNGVPATNVQVISHARALCLTPEHPPGTVDVTVRNLDDNGDPIVGEEATKANAYTFRRPDLTVESDFTRVCRTLIRKFKEQVLANTVMTTHTDYDDTTSDFLNIVKVSTMPAIILIGPEVVENRFFSLNQFRNTFTANGVESRRPPYTVDLQFTVLGVAELTRQLLDLMAATMQFVNRTRFIEVVCDPDNPELGSVRLDLDFVDSAGEPSVTSRLGESNVRTFSGTVIIRGFDLEGVNGISSDMQTGLSQQISEVQVGVSAYDAVAEDGGRDSSFPADDDALPPAPDIGDFDIIIDEQDP